MYDNIMAFFAHWGITALSLWVTSAIFHGISFASRKSLFISALLLGFVNAVIRPIVIILTIPLTLISFGFFLLGQFVLPRRRRSRPAQTFIPLRDVRKRDDRCH